MGQFKKSFEEILALQNAGVLKQKQHKDDEEHRIQCDCVKWFRLQYPRYGHNLFAVPNGQNKSKIERWRFKEEGLLSGVSDLILLLRTSEYGALLIEMKTRIGRQQETQKEWQRKIERDGYKYVVCRSLDDFMREVNLYLKDII